MDRSSSATSRPAPRDPCRSTVSPASSSGRGPVTITADGVDPGAKGELVAPGATQPVHLERRILTDPGAIADLAPSWRALADAAARSAFESPDWLLPWLRHHGADWEPRVVTWWRGEELVGAAPLAWRRESTRGLTVRRLAFLGETATPLRGWVDILARHEDRATIDAHFRRWVEVEGGDWDLFDCLRLPFGSTTARALAGGPWGRASLTGVVRSVEYVLAIPEDAAGWPGPLGRKARYNIRREARQYEEEGGSFQRLQDPAEAETVVDALRELLGSRWDAKEAYFRRDERFGPFLTDVLRAGMASGSVAAFVARRGSRIDGCMVTLSAHRSTIPFVVAFTTDPDLARFSLGKSLFQRSIEDAAARGSTEYDFLTVGDYKESFWGAEGRALESSVLGRGPLGRAVVAYVNLRRRTIPRLLGRRPAEAI